MKARHYDTRKHSSAFVKPGKSFWFYFLVVLVMYSTIRCANPVSPSGGPKDILPPVVVETEPANYSVNFAADRISISFDEFIQLKEPGSQILISPPVDEKPDYRLRGKNLVVKFNEPLKDSTTYNIFFGNSIIDLNEGNPLVNYQYVFSTGSVIDSLAIKGQVLNAFDLTAIENVFVMLYADENDTLPIDSLPYFVAPYYVARTGVNGYFELNNLRDHDYMIFALNDINSNYLFDLPNEEIAFLDTLVQPTYYKIERDTISSDTAIIEEQLPDEILDEEIVTDSIISEEIVNFIELFLFTETDSTQRLLDASLVANQKLRFVFKFPATVPHFDVLNYDFGDTIWFIEEPNKSGDTIVYWLEAFVPDILDFKVSDDTLVLDTVQIVQKKEDSKKRKKDKDKEVEGIKYKTNLKGTKLDLNKDLILTFSYPVTEFDNKGFQLIEKEDTLKIEPVFTDGINRKLKIKFPWKEETSYELFFTDSVFTDLLGRSNDSTFIDFKTKALDDYSVIRLNLFPGNICNDYIVQLMDKDQNVLKENIVSDEAKLVYDYLEPGDYIIKAICDSNGNGTWDSGDYSLKLQPEHVIYYPGIITIRSNWEIEEEWILE